MLCVFERTNGSQPHKHLIENKQDNSLSWWPCSTWPPSSGPQPPGSNFLPRSIMFTTESVISIEHLGTDGWLGKKTVMSTFIPILASTATPFQIQKTTELERFLTNLVLFFKKTCKSGNWVGGLFLQQLCQSSAEGNWHKIQSWGVRDVEKVFNRCSPWFDRESSENLLRPRSRAAVPDWPSRVLQLSFSSSCLKVSTTLYSAHLCKSGKLWSLKNHSATCGRSSVCCTEAAPRRSPFPPWWLQSRAAYFGVVGVRDPWSELGDLGDFGDLGDSWSFSELRESLPALVLSCWGVRLLQSGRFGSAPVRTISELVDNGDNWWIMRIISGWWEELVDNEYDWWIMRMIGGWWG